MLRVKFSLLFLSFICIFCSIQAADVIPGDPDAPAGQSFSFPVRAHVLRNRFHVGANNQQGGTFSIARVNKSGTVFEGLTPERVTLNGQADQPNPLFNAQINFLKLLEQNNQPIAVTQTEKDIFLVQEQSGGKSAVLSATNVKDATLTDITDGIVGLETMNEALIAAAVRANGQANFGIGTSGLTLLAPINVAQELVGTNALLGQIDATLLNITTGAVKIDNDLTAIGNVVDLHWDSFLNILYIGLQTEAGGGATDGARSVVAAHLENNRFVFTPIAPDGVFSGATDKIVGAVGANELVSIHKVRTLQTSKSFLTYLVVLGGNGSPATTQNVVFALPVVNKRIPASHPGASHSFDYSIQGTLANVTQTPTDIFGAQKRFLRREFQEAATDATQVFTDTSAAAQVGGGALPAGNIEDLFVVGETIFVTVGAAVVGQLPGIFYSEALLDVNDVIIGWTEWQRVGGTTDQVFGAQRFQLDGMRGWDGSFIFITGPDVNTSRTVKKTLWSDGADDGLKPLTDLFSQTFAQEAGGIRNLRNYPVQITALDGISLLVATGLDRVALVESARTIGGTFTPNAGEDFLKERAVFDEGAIGTTFLPASQTRYIQLAGGVLSTLGPITTSEIAVNEPNLNGWLCVGGMEGVAVLTDPTGAGWNIVTGALTNGFNGLTDQFSFKEIGSYTNTRKLMSDKGFLYVLTDTRLDRINLQTSNFATNTLDVTTVATVQTKGLKTPDILVDCVVSEKVALISTSTGVFRIGNGKDITTVVSDDDATWTELELPNSVLPVEEFFVISTTGVAQDVSRNGGGMIYALNAYAGFNQGRVNRIMIDDTTSSAVDENTIVPFNDLAFEGINSFFTTFPTFREVINFNGAILLNARDRDLGQPAQLFSGVGFKENKILPVAVDNSDENSSFSDITSITRSSASGSWLATGNFGLQVNE